ncbi:MAG: TonB-dependent receptor [Treponemataceae bacterium]
MKKGVFPILVVIFGLWVSAFSPYAEETEPGLSFTVEEDRLPEEPDTGTKADFSASIGKEDIARYAPVSLAQVLELAPGVQVTHTGTDAEGAYVSVRGSSPEQVLVLLNGKRLNSAQGGGVDLSSIDPESIERIEVLRGGASARYGENALGGVVNIITRKAKKAAGGGAYLQYGSWQTVKAGANLEGVTKDGSADGYLSLSGLYSEGAFGYASVDGSGGSTVRTNADVRAGDFYGTANFYPNDYLILKGVLSGRLDEKGVPGIPQFPTTSARMADQQASGSFDAEWERDALRAITGLSASFHQRRYVDPDYSLGAQDDTHANLAVQSDSEGRLTFAAPWAARSPTDEGVEGSIAANAVFRFDALRSTALIRDNGLEEGSGDILRYQGSAALRSQLPLIDLPFLSVRPVLYPSARFDASFTDDKAGGSVSNSSAFTWQTGIVFPWKTWNLKANAGTSYRSPSFDDLFWPSTAFAAGNPSLKPERAFAWDVGIELTPNKTLRLECSYFDRFVSDLIVWTPGAGGQWRPSNVDSARVRGVEFLGRWTVPFESIKSDGVLEGTVSWLDPRNTTVGSVSEGKLLPGKAPLTASASVELRRKEGHFFRAEAAYTSLRYITAQNTKALDPSLVFNLGVGLKLGKNGKFIGRLENIFDQIYFDLRDYPVPGRQFSVRTSYEW